METNSQTNQNDAQPAKVRNEQTLQCPKCNRQADLEILTGELFSCNINKIEELHYGCLRCNHAFSGPIPTMFVNEEYDNVLEEYDNVLPPNADTEVGINRTALATLVDYVASDVRDYGDTIPEDVREAVTVGKDSLD